MIRSKKLARIKDLKHCFFNSVGGHSKNIYKSLNCGPGSKDNKKNIKKNLQIVRKKIKKGLEKRKATLGKEYVEKNLEQADDFTLPFQKAMTEWCWGFGWGDDVIDMKTRSMMNLSMIGALGKMQEWEIHCRGAITNGVSKEEIRAIIHVIGIYCGVPQALECFRVAKKVLEEQNL